VVRFAAMKGLPAETDFIVVGAGIAGLCAALELAEAGRVLVLAKHGAPTSTPPQPGNPALLSDEEEVILHLKDTLVAGDGLCDPDAAKILVDEGPERIQALISWDKIEHKKTSLVFENEASYSHSQVLRVPGDSAVGEVKRVLQSKVRSTKNISVCEREFCTEILTEDQQATGMALIDDKGLPREIACSAVLLATGGLGQLYANTTNSTAATGDGVAMAFCAGAEVSDMEFVQFHPTSLYMKKVPRFLLSERLRSDGAHLRNIEMDRFMDKYHPLAEKAPADVVARAILHEMEVSGSRDAFVYLDLTHLSAARVQQRFPRIHATCMSHNIDITEDMIPVRPAAHFAIGGVKSNLEGKTSVVGLYAAGETAATAVHGGNRFPSNSLLEALVFGARAGMAMRNELKASPAARLRERKATSQNGPVDAGIEDAIRQIQDVMWKKVGVVRSRKAMQEAVGVLEGLAPRLAHPRTRRSHEAANLHTAGLLVARSALAREESRGAHYRIDYPGHDDKKFLKHSVIKGQSVGFV
jgi:L-aspartate oxidase